MNFFAVEDIPLRHAEFVVKESHLTGTVRRLGVTIVDDLQECVFCQVLRVGRGIKNRRNINPGKLIIIHKKAGRVLGGLTRDTQVPHYIIHESNVVACIQM